MTFELVKLTQNASTLSLRGFSIPTIDYQVNEQGSVYQNFNASWQGDINASASTCSVGNVNVNLGSHASSVFVNTGDKSPAVPVVVNVTCRRATPDVGIKIDPVFLTVNASNGIFSLDPGSSATGIGVQLMTQNGTPVNLDLPIKNSTVAATSFSFPLQAAFIKTGATVRSGSARSSLRTTITYQ
ncbi:fimbrial protein [Pseudomonas sp. B329]|uniref:fimbrial protein n=1 Tax=Pseudomonas sp. B329 TaxID=1553459 RepID=UPI0020033D49|nr:fimbrial protein [Pseudomonas sp. B329]